MNLSITALAVIALFIMPGAAFSKQYQRHYPGKKLDATEFIVSSLIIGIVVVTLNFFLLLLITFIPYFWFPEIDRFDYQNVDISSVKNLCFTGILTGLYVIWSLGISMIFGELFSWYTLKRRHEVCSAPWQLFIPKSSDAKFVRAILKNNIVYTGCLEVAAFDNKALESAERDFVLVHPRLETISDIGTISNTNKPMINSKVLINTRDCVSIEICYKSKPSELQSSPLP